MGGGVFYVLPGASSLNALLTLIIITVAIKVRRQRGHVLAVLFIVAEAEQHNWCARSKASGGRSMWPVPLVRIKVLWFLIIPFRGTTGTPFIAEVELVLSTKTSLAYLAYTANTTKCRSRRSIRK